MFFKQSIKYLYFFPFSLLKKFLIKIKKKIRKVKHKELIIFQKVHIQKQYLIILLNNWKLNKLRYKRIFALYKKLKLTQNK